MDRPRQPIQAAAEACATKFASLLATPPSVPARRKATVETRRADFNLWVDDVGALGKPAISLDTRLHGRTRDINLVTNVLAILGDSADYCAEMLLHSNEDDEGDEAFHASVMNLDAALDSLAQIGMAIRRTGKASRNRRADRTFDPAKYPEFRRHLECIVLLRASSQGLSDIDASELSDIQTRLIEANLRRRHKFVLAQKRCLMQDAASREEERAREQAAQELQESEDASADQDRRNLGLRPAALAQDTIRRPKSAPVPAARGKAAVTPTISHISASTAEGSLKYSKDTKYKAGIAKTNITSIATTAEFPGAPRLDDGKKMGRCPCCCQALSAEILQTPTSWKKHVIEDLCPYTCVAKNCPKPDALFTSREEWETHFAESHPPRWECPFCEEADGDHDTPESMRDHLDSQHADELRDNDLPDDLSWCEVQKMGITTCPLCASTGPEDAPELVDHVLHHTYDFALRALPWPRPVEHDVSAPPGTFGLADEPEKRQLIEQYVEAVVPENFEDEDEQPGEPVVAQLWGYEGDCAVPAAWHPSEYSEYFDDEMNRYFYDASHEDQDGTDVAVQDRDSDADAASEAFDRFTKQDLQRPLTDAEKGILATLIFASMDYDTPHVEPTPDSCAWFTRHERTDKWTRQNRGILCVRGPAGSGKTTLLRYTRDAIERISGDSSIILWYQFRRDVHLKNEPVYFFRAMLHQLLRQVPNAASSLRQFFLDGEPVEMEPASLQLVLSGVLSDAVRACPVFLFVDGTDECDEGDALSVGHYLYALLDDVPPTDNALRICVSGREMPFMWPTVRSAMIDLEEEHYMDMIKALTRAGRRNVEEYIGDEVYDGPELESCRAHVLSWLVSMLRGDGSTSMEIRDSIRAFPLGLQDLYPWILTKSKDYWSTLRMMRWLCYSTRPLTTDELRWAMYTDPLSPGDSLEAFSSSAWAIPHKDMVHHIERLSCGLARLDGDDRWVLFHPTVRGVLVDDRPEELQGGPQAANGIPCELALSCLGYLAMVMESGQSTATPEDRSELVFLDYAARSWIAHAKEVDYENMQHVYEILQVRLVDFWLRCCHDMAALDNLPRGTSALHLAASEGMTALFRFMLNEWPGARSIDSLNARDSLGHTPLALAAAEGHVDVVEILLDAEGVDVDRADFEDWTPLSLAVTNGHEKIAFMLLGARADASVRGPEGQPLFSVAIANRLDHLATLLLMQVTPLDQDDGYSAESLCLAAARGYENVVSELLERGVGVDVRDHNGVTPLDRAATEGRTDVVELLLQKGADLHVSNSWPLFIASTRGYADTVAVLLKRGADANARDTEGDTPLAMAVRNGHTDVVRMLIDAGADPNVDYPNDLTPLTEAAVWGIGSMVDVLLQCGADPDYYDQGNHTPLTRAIVGGQDRVVKMLLEAGAYASHTGPDGQTPLFMAAASGNEKIVELLLDVGNVHPGQMSRHGVLPMTIARQNGHDGVVGLLESRMSDPGEGSRTPTSIHGEAVNYVQGDHDDEDAGE